MTCGTLWLSEAGQSVQTKGHLHAHKHLHSLAPKVAAPATEARVHQVLVSTESARSVRGATGGREEDEPCSNRKEEGRKTQGSLKSS
eukprot:1189332-Amphidinium_carterae.1